MSTVGFLALDLNLRSGRNKHYECISGCPWGQDRSAVGGDRGGSGLNLPSVADCGDGGDASVRPPDKPRRTVCGTRTPNASCMRPACIRGQHVARIRRNSRIGNAAPRSARSRLVRGAAAPVEAVAARLQHGQASRDSAEDADDGGHEP